MTVRILLLALCLLLGACASPPSQRAQWTALKPEVEESISGRMIQSAGQFLHGKLARKEVPGIGRNEHGTFDFTLHFSNLSEAKAFIRSHPPYPQRVAFEVKINGRAARQYTCVVARSRPEGSWRIEKFQLQPPIPKN
jgi:hypothetical protein